MQRFCREPGTWHPQNAQQNNHSSNENRHWVLAAETVEEEYTKLRTIETPEKRNDVEKNRRIDVQDVHLISYSSYATHALLQNNRGSE